MLDAIRWDTELIRRYGQAALAYPGYPAADQFHSGVGSFDLLQALRSSRLAQRPLALHLQLPFSTAIGACCCSRVITKDRSRSLPYLQQLQGEIDQLSRHLGAQQRVAHLYWGGGSPTFLNHDELRQLMGHLRRRCRLLDDDAGDYAIDIDPREADWPTLGLLRELGFNRLNIGVHALEPQVQQVIDRVHSLQQLRSLLEAARTLHYRSVNVELAYGLPRQTPAGFAGSLAAIIALQPDRLALRDWPPPPQGAGRLPGDAQRQDMLRGAIEQLTLAGYRYIGLGQFALPDDELAMAQESGRLRRTAQGYGSHGDCDLIGFGLAAISRVGTVCAQNASAPAHYRQLIASGQPATVRGLRCTADDQLRRSVIETLLCDFQLDMQAIEARFALVFRDYFAAAWPGLEQLARDGLIELGEGFIDVRPAGRLLVPALCRLFEPAARQQDAPRWLRAVSQ